MIRFIICIVILSIVSSLAVADDPCRFEISGKGFIDLSSIGNTDGTCAFPDRVPSSGGSSYKFSYNPCKPFSEGSACQNVAACQVSLDGLLQFSIGKQDSAKWDAGDAGRNPTVTYTDGPKITQVELICTDNKPGDVISLGEGPQEFYKFQLSSKCACPGGCEGKPTPGPGGGGGAIGPGAIFLIILVAGVFIYFVVFAIINRFVRHQSGADLIAHRTFWVAVPGYSKNGVLFLVRKITRRGGSHESI